MTNKGERNRYLDAVRGTAIISIILIHTAFASGYDFVDDWFRSLVLLIDVPLFFFIAGISHSYNFGNVLKTIKSLFKIWLKYMYFVLFITILYWFTSDNPNLNFAIQSFLGSWNLNIKFKALRMLCYSMWFLPVYFSVVFLNQAIYYLIKKFKINKNHFFLLYIIILIFGIIYISLHPQPYSKNLFYCFFFAIGSLYGINEEFKINTKSFIFFLQAIFISTLLSSWLLHSSLNPMQSNKFPPNIIYLCASMFSILFAVYLKQFIKKTNSFLEHIGRNSLWYYFGQGMGADITYNFIWMNIPNPSLKFFALFIINFTISTLIAEILIQSYRLITFKFKKQNQS